MRSLVRTGDKERLHIVAAESQKVDLAFSRRCNQEIFYLSIPRTSPKLEATSTFEISPRFASSVYVHEYNIRFRVQVFNSFLGSTTARRWRRRYLSSPGARASASGFGRTKAKQTPSFRSEQRDHQGAGGECCPARYY
jgi:hypothetical protein